MPAGFRGLLDFIGYPVGQGVPAPTGGVAVGGRRFLVRQVLHQAMRNSVLNNARAERIQMTLAKRERIQVLLSSMERAFQKRITEGAIYTALFSEL